MASDARTHALTADENGLFSRLILTLELALNKTNNFQRTTPRLSLKKLEPRPRGLVSSGLVRALGGRLRETDAGAAVVEARAGVPAAEGPPQPPRAPGPSPGRGGRRAADLAR